MPEWLELLRPFASVKNLALSDKAAGCLTPALQGLTGSTVETITGMLPALENLLLEASVRSGPTHDRKPLRSSPPPESFLVVL
jgi:hypothetical protein